MAAGVPGGGATPAGGNPGERGPVGNGARHGREAPRAHRALERMGKPQPKPAGAAPPPDEVRGRPGGGSGSATGFVGTLAQDALDAAEGKNPSGETRSGRLNLPMAREIKPQPKAPAGIAAPAAPKAGDGKKVEDGGRGMGVGGGLMLVLAGLLVVIGAWAAGALWYMAQVTPGAPSQVWYPFVRWNYDAGPTGGYAAETRRMAWTLLMCLPVAGMLVGIAMKAGRKKT